MSRKRIEQVVPELHEKLVYYELYSHLTGYGRVIAEGSDFFILQNSEDGVPCDTTDPNFSFSFMYDPSDITLYELTPDESRRLEEKLELLSTLNEGDTIFYNGDLVEVSKKSDGIYVGSKKLSIESNFMKISNPDTFYKDLYKDILECKYIHPDYKSDIEHKINRKEPWTGYTTFIVNGDWYAFYINSDLTISYKRVDSRKNSFYHVDLDSTLYDKKYSVQDYKLFIQDFLELFQKKTFFSNSLRSVLENIECDQTIKNKLLEGNFYNNVNFIDYDSQSGMISYIPKGKELVFEGENLTPKNRQTQKPHKFFNTVLKDSGASEYDIKCFADKLLAFYNSWTVKYLKGAKFAQNYSQINTRGWQTKSCMDRKAENFFEIYTQPPFRLGVIYREGVVVGRFIEVTTDDKFVYNDRLYYKDETVVAWYNSWCDQNKITRKERNSFDSKDKFYNIEKGNFTKKVTVTLRKQLESFTIYPYMDTLSYGFKNKLQNFDSESVRFNFTGAESTAGQCTRVRCRMDVLTKKWIENEFAIRIDFGKDAGYHTTVENLIYSGVNKGHCLK